MLWKKTTMNKAAPLSENSSSKANTYTPPWKKSRKVTLDVWQGLLFITSDNERVDHVPEAGVRVL